MSVKFFPAESQHPDNISATFSLHGMDPEAASVISDMHPVEEVPVLDTSAPTQEQQQQNGEAQQRAGGAAPGNSQVISFTENSVLLAVQHGEDAAQQPGTGENHAMHVAKLHCLPCVGIVLCITMCKTCNVHQAPDRDP